MLKLHKDSLSEWISQLISDLNSMKLVTDNSDTEHVTT